jgi:CheY-like chemotaxis protein
MKMIPRIILIEDNPGDIHLLRHGFDMHRWEYELQILADGEEALKFIRSNHAASAPPPCVIVLDMHLPKLDGIAVLKALKQDSLLSHIHVVVLSSIISPTQKTSLLSLGADLYREKPGDLKTFVSLSEEIMAICNGRALQDESRNN